MRIRHTTWSFAAVLLLGTAMLGQATPASSGSSSTSSTSAKPKVSARRTSTSASVHSTTAHSGAVHSSRTSAVRRHGSAHPVLAHAQMSPTPSRITEIQTALARDGAYQGDPSGRWDAATVDAMRQFQNDHDLNPSGKIDALTLQKLGLGSQVAGMGAPLPVAVPQASAADNNEETERP